MPPPLLQEVSLALLGEEGNPVYVIRWRGTSLRLAHIDHSCEMPEGGSHENMQLGHQSHSS
jgi:hypothetical protein